MTIKTNRYFILPLLLAMLNCKVSMAQQETDISAYLDDNNISSKTNLVSVDASGTLRGVYQLFFEHLFFENKAMGGEIGFGVLAPHYHPSFFDAGNFINEIGLSNPGYMVSGGLAFHPNIGFDRLFFSFNASYRAFKEIGATECSTTVGWQLYIFNRFVLEPSFSLGYEFYSPKTTFEGYDPEMDRMGLILNPTIKFAYIF